MTLLASTGEGNLGLFYVQSLREKCPNTELFLVRIFLYRTECSVQPFHAVQSFLMF